MISRTAAFLAVVVLAAACSSGESSESSGTLLTSTVPTTTTSISPGTSASTTTSISAPTTTVAPTTTTSTTTTSSSMTTTTASSTGVAGSGDGDTLDTLQELPFTGVEPQVTAVALLALLVGVWLLRWSGIWQIRLSRLQSRRWRRPGAPSAQTSPLWPPNAIAPRSDADRRFQEAVRRHASRHGVSFLEGVDRYATRVAANPVVGRGEADDPHAKWLQAVADEVRAIYGAP